MIFMHITGRKKLKLITSLCLATIFSFCPIASNGNAGLEIGTPFVVSASVHESSFSIAGIKYGSSREQVERVFGDKKQNLNSENGEVKTIDFSKISDGDIVSNTQNSKPVSGKINAREQLGVSGGVDKSNNGISIIKLDGDKKSKNSDGQDEEIAPDGTRTIHTGAGTLSYKDSNYNPVLSNAKTNNAMISNKSSSNGNISSAIPMSTEKEKYKNGKVIVNYVGDSVEFIEVRITGYRTADGVEVGDSSRRIEKIYGEPDLSNYNHKTQSGTYFYHGTNDHSLGIQFKTEKGVVKSISIGKFKVS